MISQDPNTEKLVAAWNLLAELARTNQPEDFSSMFHGLIANLVGNMSEGYFERLVKIEPCERVGCNCHVVIKPVGVAYFKASREDWQTNKVEETQSE
jgi:hypothetical protein